MLGWTLTDLCAFDAAIEQLERGLSAAERDGSEAYLVRCLAHLSLACWLGGERGRATDSLERVEAMFETVTAPEGAAFLHGAHAYLAAARVRLALGDHARAERLSAAVLAPAKSAGWEEVAADGSVVIGRCREGAERCREPFDRIAWDRHPAGKPGRSSH